MEKELHTSIQNDPTTSDASRVRTHPVIDTSASVARVNAIAPVHSFNAFMVKLEAMLAHHADWRNPRNQRRPFKNSFIEFIKVLTLRMPSAPNLSPMSDGSVKMEFRKMNQPRHDWQILTFKIFPRRYFEMVAKSRKPSVKPFRRTNVCRADVIAEIVTSFFHDDTVNTQDHPIRYRKATKLDYPAIATLAHSVFGPTKRFSPKGNPCPLSFAAEYCVIAEDPIYGIVSMACVGKSMIKPSTAKNKYYEVTFVHTVQSLRGLGIGEKCVRKAIANLKITCADAHVTASPIMNMHDSKDNCKSMLTRCGFKRECIEQGYRKHKEFMCDRCNVEHGHCEFTDSESVCATAYYVLGDHGGPQGYCGKTETL